MTVKPRAKPEDSDEDPVENMLKKTGCLELHYKVQVGYVYQLFVVRPVLTICPSTAFTWYWTQD